MTCDHDALRKDAEAWAALPLVGIQRCVEGDPDLEIRQCRTCLTTLAIEIKETK